MTVVKLNFLFIKDFLEVGTLIIIICTAAQMFFAFNMSLSEEFQETQLLWSLFFFIPPIPFRTRVAFL